MGRQIIVCKLALTHTKAEPLNSVWSTSSFSAQYIIKQEEDKNEENHQLGNIVRFMNQLEILRTKCITMSKENHYFNPGTEWVKSYLLHSPFSS